MSRIVVATLCRARVAAGMRGSSFGARGRFRVSVAVVASAGAVLHTVGLPGTGAAAPRARPAAAGVSARVSALTPRQLAGQLVIYSYRGLTPPAGLLERISAGEASGVILFEDNISGRRQIREVIDRLQQAAAQSPVRLPLLMMTDQEGGLVRRLAGEPLLSEKQIGASAQPAAAARHAGHGAGRNLRGVGINVNLAPVLDVFRVPGDFIDRFGRSYSRNPRTVAKLGRAFIRAQQATGVAATAKHFPGLGAATRTQNTDQRPVILHVPITSLRARDELPYRSAIAARARLVMVSWARYPALDARRPAGLSSTVVHGELRRRLGFTGVTVTDAVGAGALRSFGTTRNRAVLAVRAGMDLVLCAGQRVHEATSATSGLAAALRTGQLDMSAVRASVDRVMALRSSMAA